MRHWRSTIVWAGLMLLAAACSGAVPLVTPTVAASATPGVDRTRTPAATRTLVVLLPTASATPSVTASVTPSGTPSMTPSVTPSITPSGTPSTTPSITPSGTPSTTPSVTASVTASPTPSVTPSATPTLPPSPTPLPTLAPPTRTRTLAPTATATRTQTATASASPTATWTASPPPPSSTPTFDFTASALSFEATAQSMAVTMTALASRRPPIPTPGVTFVPPVLPSPTLFVATVQATDQAALVLSPTPGGALPSPAAGGESGTAVPTQTATPAATDIVLIPNAPPPVPTTIAPGVRSFALSTAAGLVVAQGVALPGGASTFSVSSDGRVARVGVQGALYLSASWDQPGERVSFSPFSAFEPDSPEHNNARVAQAAWSPDGRLLAFLIDTDSDASPDNDSNNDGVWFLVPEVTRATDPSYQLIRDCPPEAGCSLILGAGDQPPQRRRSLYFEWNFQSSALLVSVELVDQGRRAVLVVDAVPDPAYASRQQLALLYEYASWVPDRNSVVLSGAGPDGLPVVARLDRDSGQTTVLYSAAADGRMVRSAVQTSAGRVFALTGADAMAPVVLSEIADGGARPLTEPIGQSAPVRVQWSPARDAVLLVMLEDGVRRTFVAQVNGQVEELTAQVADALAVEWVAGRLPPAAAPPASPTPTAGVALPLGAVAFAPGETVVTTIDGLNVRVQPSIGAPVAALLPQGTALVITGSLLEGEGFRWYPVRLSDQITGFAAAFGPDGAPYLRRP